MTESKFKLRIKTAPFFSGKFQANNTQHSVFHKQIWNHGILFFFCKSNAIWVISIVSLSVQWNFLQKIQKFLLATKWNLATFFFSNFLSAKVPASPISFSAFFSLSLSGKISGRGLNFFEGSNSLFSRFFSLQEMTFFIFSQKYFALYFKKNLNRQKLYKSRNLVSFKSMGIFFCQKFAWKLNLWDWCKIHTHSFFSSFLVLPICPWASNTPQILPPSFVYLCIYTTLTDYFPRCVFSLGLCWSRHPCVFTTLSRK